MESRKRRRPAPMFKLVFSVLTGLMISALSVEVFLILALPEISGSPGDGRYGDRKRSRQSCLPLPSPFRQPVQSANVPLSGRGASNANPRSGGA
jgi:hypothetical protein